MKKPSRSIPVVICVVTLIATCALAQVQGAWVTSNMTAARSGHAQVTLGTGALAAGGTDGVNVLASAELYNAASGKWAATSSMTQARENFPAVVLSNGKVLVSGGLGASSIVLASAELYDPTTGAWSSAGVLSVARYGHTANPAPERQGVGDRRLYGEQLQHRHGGQRTLRSGVERLIDDRQPQHGSLFSHRRAAENREGVGRRRLRRRH